MADPRVVESIMQSVTIPVMAKCRIGHFVEAQVLQSLGVDYIDESEVLTPADERHHINKHTFTVPFVCGARDLGEALRRIGEGAAMIRTKGEAGTGNIVEATRHIRTVMGEIRKLHGMTDDELMAEAKALEAPYELRVRGRAHGQAARREFRGRRYRHACRCRAHDAARDGGRLCRLGDLQIGGPRSPRGCRRSCRDLLQRPRRHSRGISRPGRADARHRAVHSASGRAARPLVGGSPVRIGVLALQGAFREHLQALTALDVEAVEVRRPEDLDGLDGLIIPGGESTTIRMLMRELGLDTAAARSHRRGLARPGDVRGPDRAGRSC